MKTFSKLHLEKNQDSTGYFIKDAVHNEIEFSGENIWIYDLINTPEMQRLAKILQLSLSYHNFPTATHTRLSHCLGAYQVCQKIINHLVINGDLDLNPKTQIQINIALASAILHDIGHGPHSHAFEKYLNFSHEINAVSILKDPKTAVHQIMVQKARNDQLPDHFYIEHVAKIINKQNDQVELNWVQDLISSQIDTDRLDYLMRDSYFSGVSYGNISLDLLIKWITITNKKMRFEINNNNWINRIAFQAKAKLLVQQFLNARLAMYLELYENYYSSSYETIVSLIIERFKQVYQKNKEQKLIEKYHFLYQLIIPYFDQENWFEYESFLKLNDENFNLIINSFQEADDPVLRSLSCLFHGNMSKTDHRLLRVKPNEAFEMLAKYQKKFGTDPKKLDFLMIKNRQVVFYNDKEPLLIYDPNENLVVDGWKYLLKNKLINDEKIISRAEHNKIILVSKKFLNEIT